MTGTDPIPVNTVESLTATASGGAVFPSPPTWQVTKPDGTPGATPAPGANTTVTADQTGSYFATATCNGISSSFYFNAIGVASLMGISPLAVGSTTMSPRATASTSIAITTRFWGVASRPVSPRQV